MSSIFGNIIKISIFGESHGSYIGMTIDGLPSGILLDVKQIQNDLLNRHSHNKYSTKRVEQDKVEFISGLFRNKTTGSPLTFLIKNKNIKSSDYKEGNIRPSHADYTNFIKYDGFNDYRGGGFSSGRLTACFIVLGTICKQLLNKDIKVVSQIKSIGNIVDRDINFKNLNKEFTLLDKNLFSVLDNKAKSKMLKEIDRAMSDGDSIGGTVRTFVKGLPTGLGEPFFDSFESIVSHLLFSIGGIVGVSFGQGFDICNKLGSQVNDQIRFKNNKVEFLSNNCGGINGGITNGNIVIINCAIKPTSSIAKKQQSINLLTKKNINLKINGRHDPCIVHRIKPVINAIIYYAMLELTLLAKARKYEK